HDCYGDVDHARGRHYKHNCGREHSVCSKNHHHPEVHNRVHQVDLQKQFHIHNVVVNDKYDTRYKHNHHGLDHNCIYDQVDNDHRDQHDLNYCASDEHNCGGELLDVDFDNHDIDARCQN
ncbi:hypothetical protein AAVH_24072, partial [Aphelenchoides avenae]